MNKRREVVWRWDFRLSQEDDPAGVLPAEDLRRAANITDPARRERHLRTRRLVRRVLAGHLGCAPADVGIEILPSGKPRLTLGRPHFSLSHSGDWLVVVIADGEVGVDVEASGPRLDPRLIARRYFSPADRDRLEEGGDEGGRRKRFLWQWVAKEAALKAAGTGLANTIERAECVYRGKEITAVGWDDRIFAVRNFVLADGTPGAVAVAGAAEIDLREGRLEA